MRKREEAVGKLAINHQSVDLRERCVLEMLCSKRMQIEPMVCRNKNNNGIGAKRLKCNEMDCFNES